MTDGLKSVDRREGLSFRDFEQDYLLPRRAVVLLGAADAWPAMTRWTPEFFAERYRGRKVSCRYDEGAWTMDGYVAALASSTPERPLPYLRNLNIQTDYPELVPDIEPKIAFAAPDWLSSRLMPRDWLRPNHLNQLFISGRGARITLHYDDWMTHNMVTNISGEKRFVLYDPGQGGYLYRRGGRESGEDYILSAVDPWRPDLERFPLFAKAAPVDVVIGPGETLFVPAGWWHSSFTESTCISVSSSFANWSNWNSLIAEIGRLRMKENPAKRAAVQAFLAGVGGALSLLRGAGVTL
jgi:hypothetical protein